MKHKFTLLWYHQECRSVWEKAIQSSHPSCSNSLRWFLYTIPTTICSGCFCTAGTEEETGAWGDCSGTRSLESRCWGSPSRPDQNRSRTAQADPKKIVLNINVRNVLKLFLIKSVTLQLPGKVPYLIFNLDLLKQIFFLQYNNVLWHLIF